MAAGAPSTKAWRGRGGLPTWAGSAPGGPSPRGPASCPAGQDLGCCGSRHSGLSAGPSTLQGRRVSGVRPGLTQLGLRGGQGSAWRPNQREKVTNGTDVRPLTPTPRVRNGVGGAGPGGCSRCVGLGVPGRRRGHTTAASGSRCPQVLPDLDTRTGHTLANTPSA